MGPRSPGKILSSNVFIPEADVYESLDLPYDTNRRKRHIVKKPDKVSLWRDKMPARQGH